jgi:beta-lactamase class A
MGNVADLDERLQRLADRFSGRLALAAKEISTGEEVQFNAHQVWGTASSIKIAIMMEVFQQAKNGKLDLGKRVELQKSDQVGGSGILQEFAAGLAPTIGDLTALMIVLSDNTATNMLLDRLGGVETVNKSLRDKGFQTLVIHSPVDFDVIGDDIRRFAEGSPAELMRLVELFVRGEIVDGKSCEAMLGIMKRQQYLDQIPRYIDFNPYAEELKLEEEVMVASKTGFFTGTRVDAGALFLPEGRTICICVMSHEGKDHSFAPENEGAVVNGLVGRLLLEHWWPDGEPPQLDSAYVDQWLGGDA